MEYQIINNKDLLSLFYKGEGDIKEIVSELRSRYQRDGSLTILTLLFNVYHVSDFYQSAEREIAGKVISQDEKLAAEYLMELTKRTMWAKLYAICLVNQYQLDLSLEECGELFDSYSFDLREEGIYFLDMYDLTMSMLGIVSKFFRGSRDKLRAEKALDIFDSLEGE